MAQSREGGDMQTGSVKWFGDDEAHVFISPNDGSEAVSVHHREEGPTSSRTRRS
jgi:hypothetical protein